LNVSARHGLTRSSVYAYHPTWSRPSPAWLSLQQAAIVYGVSVDSLRRRNRPRPGIPHRRQTDPRPRRRPRPALPADPDGTSTAS